MNKFKYICESLLSEAMEYNENILNQMVSEFDKLYDQLSKNPSDKTILNKLRDIRSKINSMIHPDTINRSNLDESLKKRLIEKLSRINGKFDDAKRGNFEQTFQRAGQYTRRAASNIYDKFYEKVNKHMSNINKKHINKSIRYNIIPLALVGILTIASNIGYIKQKDKEKGTNKNKEKLILTKLINNKNKCSESKNPEMCKYIIDQQINRLKKLIKNDHYNSLHGKSGYNNYSYNTIYNKQYNESVVLDESIKTNIHNVYKKVFYAIIRKLKRLKRYISSNEYNKLNKEITNMIHEYEDLNVSVNIKRRFGFDTQSIEKKMESLLYKINIRLDKALKLGKIDKIRERTKTASISIGGGTAVGYTGYKLGKRTEKKEAEAYRHRLEKYGNSKINKLEI